jgi:preprotein translocase subunit SecD
VNPGRIPDARVSFFEDRTSEPVRLDITIDVYGRDAASVNRIEERLAAQGVIEFRVVAHKSVPEEAPQDVMTLPTRPKASAQHAHDTAADEAATQKPAAAKKAEWIAVAPRAVREFLDDYGTPRNYYVTRTSQSAALEALVLMDDFHIDGDDIARVELGDYGDGVTISFNSRGAEKMRKLTSNPQYLKSGWDEEIRRLAIIVDDEIYMLHQLGAIITDKLELRGNLTEDESRTLVAILKTGPLPATLTQTSRKDLD